MNVLLPGVTGYAVMAPLRRAATATKYLNYPAFRPLLAEATRLGYLSTYANGCRPAPCAVGPGGSAHPNRDV